MTFLLKMQITNCGHLWATYLFPNLCSLAIISQNIQEVSPAPWQNVVNTVWLSYTFVLAQPFSTCIKDWSSTGALQKDGPWPRNLLGWFDSLYQAWDVKTTFALIDSRVAEGIRFHNRSWNNGGFECNVVKPDLV